jgi:hypothetical protein
VACPEVEGLPGAEDQGQAIVDSTQRPLQGAFLTPPVLPVVLIMAGDEDPGPERSIPRLRYLTPGDRSSGRDAQEKNEGPGSPNLVRP